MTTVTTPDGTETYWLSPPIGPNPLPETAIDWLCGYTQNWMTNAGVQVIPPNGNDPAEIRTRVAALLGEVFRLKAKCKCPEEPQPVPE